MRSIYTAAVLGVLMAGTMAFNAHATGDVLVPSNDSSSSNAPNLGLVPESSQPSPSSSQLHTPPAPASVSVLPQMQSENPYEDGLTRNLPYTPSPTGAASPQVATAVAAAMKTQVMKLPDSSAQLQPPAENLPNSVAIETDARWTPGDIQKVSDQLGIVPKQVTSLCKFSVKGYVVSDKGNVPYDAGTASHITVKYDGKAVMAILATMALCSTNIQLPPNKGTIMQIGDYYAVPLGSGSCQLPADKPMPAKIAFNPGQFGLLQCSF